MKVKHKVEDDDDVVIIGDIMPKPMISRNKEIPKKRIQYKKSDMRESLVITHKLKVKKHKHKCVIKDTNVNERQHLKTQNSEVKSTKSSFEGSKCANNSSVLLHSCDRFAPVCFRQNCMRRCKIEKSNKKRSKGRFPKDLKRLLSPVSLTSFGNTTSNPFDFEISLDTSTFKDEKETKLDTLIKRTRDRDRILQTTRTQFLCTPPHTDTQVTEEIIEDIELDEWKPPYTSTPKYEDVDNEKMSIPNKYTDQLKKELDDIMISPIKKYNYQSTVPNKNNDQNVAHQKTSITHINNVIMKSKEPNKSIKNMIISPIQQCNYTPVDSNVDERNIVDEKVPNTNNYAGKSINEMKKCHNDLTMISNRDHTLSLDHTPLLDEINTDFSRNCDQKQNDKRMSISYNNNNLTEQPNRDLNPFVEDIQHKQTKYKDTTVLNMNYEQNTESIIPFSKDKHNKSEFFDTNYRKNAVDTRMTTTDYYELLNAYDSYFFEDIHHKVTDNKPYRHSPASNLNCEQHIEDNENFTALSNRDHSPFVDNINKHKEYEYTNMHTEDFNSNVNWEENTKDGQMSISYMDHHRQHSTSHCWDNDDYPKRSNRDYSPFSENFNENRKSERYKQSAEDRDMSVSFSDYFAEQTNKDRTKYSKDKYFQQETSEYYRYTIEDRNMSYRSYNKKDIPQRRNSDRKYRSSFSKDDYLYKKSYSDTKYRQDTSRKINDHDQRNKTFKHRNYDASHEDNIRRETFRYNHSTNRNYKKVVYKCKTRM